MFENRGIFVKIFPDFTKNPGFFFENPGIFRKAEVSEKLSEKPAEKLSEKPPEKPAEKLWEKQWEKVRNPGKFCSVKVLLHGKVFLTSALQKIPGFFGNPGIFQDKFCRF